MKILMVRRVSGAFGYITDGMVNALRSKGHEVKRFDGEMRTWEEFDPDIYIDCYTCEPLWPCRYPRRNK